MGKATRWLKSLLGIKNSKDYSKSGDRKDKKRCSIGHSGKDSSGGLCRNTTTIPPPNISPAEARLRSYYNEAEKELNKHVMAVAAATAATADAAVAAAKAAVAVMRLTSHGRGTMFGGEHERWAAVKIQTVFRGHLARKALRALKGLVKLQALVRGYLVRKQATIRSQKARGLINHETNRFDIRAQKFMERLYSFDTANGIDESSKIVEVDIGRPKSRSSRNNASESNFSNDRPLHRTLSSSFLRLPARISIQDSRRFQGSDWCLSGDECWFSTTKNTPRVISYCGSNASIIPAKSVRADNWFRHYGNFPNYKANTQSFKAKLRSHSAPK